MKKKKKQLSSIDVAKMGGVALLKKRGKTHMKEIGKLGAKARWNK